MQRDQRKQSNGSLAILGVLLLFLHFFCIF